ncbi:hypothetical protein [Streptomyces sp. NPDC046821]|uniref:hypothetical protein n=1 Tax=Streptomyces sp. NPDC046821 TaxID=3154702 RepID=UPI00340BC966
MPDAVYYTLLVGDELALVLPQDTGERETFPADPENGSPKCGPQRRSLPSSTQPPA